MCTLMPIGLENRKNSSQKMHTSFTLEDNSFLGHRGSKEVFRSSIESEYRSVENTTGKLRWVCSFLTDLGIQLQQAPVIYCDNVGTTYMWANPVFHTRMKHIAVDYHYILEKIQSGALCVTHVSTRDQLADALTKLFLEYRVKQIVSRLESLKVLHIKGIIELPIV